MLLCCYIMFAFTKQSLSHFHNQRFFQTAETVRRLSENCARVRYRTRKHGKDNGTDAGEPRVSIFTLLDVPPSCSVPTLAASHDFFHFAATANCQPNSLKKLHPASSLTRTACQRWETAIRLQEMKSVV